MRRVLIFILVLVTDQTWMWVQPALALSDQRDATALFSALNDLMGFAAPGRSVTWDNPETGNSGKVTALQPTTIEGRSCWGFERTYEDRGTMAVQGTACEIEPGLWEIVREGQPQALAAAQSLPQPAGPAEVREAQSLLRKLQYDPGPADGIYGQRTRHAVIAYQRDRGFEPSGAVTERVLASLRQDVAALQPPTTTEPVSTTPAPARAAPAGEQPPQTTEEELPWLKPKADDGMAVPQPPPASN